MCANVIGVAEALDNGLLLLWRELHQATTRSTEAIRARDRFEVSIREMQSAHNERTVYPDEDAQTPPARPMMAALWTLPLPTRLVSTYAKRIEVGRYELHVQGFKNERGIHLARTW